MQRTRAFKASTAFIACVLSSLLFISYGHADGNSTSRSADQTLALLRAAIERAPEPTPEERVQRCLSLLKEEMASPSTPCWGMVGGPIDTGYLQSVIMGSICTFHEQGLVREKIRSLVKSELASTPIKDKALRDRLVLVVGWTGDKGVISQIIAILENSAEPFMREQASRLLGDLNAKEAISALKRALNKPENKEQVHVSFDDSKGRPVSKPMLRSGPILAAARALRKLGCEVPEGIEIVDARYGVKCVEPLLYLDKDDLCKKAINVLGHIGGAEAETALQTFVENQTANANKKSLVEEAQATMKKIQADK